MANRHNHDTEIPILAVSTPAASILNLLSFTPEVSASPVGPPAAVVDVGEGNTRRPPSRFARLFSPSRVRSPYMKKHTKLIQVYVYSKTDNGLA